MTRSDGGGDPASDGLDAVAELVREASPPMTPLQRMRGLHAVTARRELRQRRRRVMAVVSALSACGLAAAAVVALVATRGRGTVVAPGASNPISYRVDHGEIGDGGYLRSYGGTGVGLRFAEGTELRLAAGARGRLTSVDAQGARFAIEQGEAEVSVAPRERARWLIDAGPFLITVHGTVFTASWDGAKERLDVKMKHGLVSVTGPVADGRIAVRAGQRLTINVQGREVLLRPNDEADAPPAPAALEPGAPEAPPPATAAPARPVPRAAARTASATIGARAAAAPARSWTSALAVGDFQGILREAEHHGLRRSLAEAHSDDLAALADAARYLRREEIARQALVAQRDRFPRSERAREAAFLLGRLTETGAEGDVRALSWYDRYLAEAPTGAYASEALGRKMTATEKLKGLAAAREIARDYLRRFPHGTYAGAARALSETP
jgi:hypothetical protein